jgi:hypothetical protein
MNAATFDFHGITLTRAQVRWVICDRCNGHAKHDHPAFSNGITADEWNSPDWDDDSREGYLSGRYDVPCSVCDGLGRVAEPLPGVLTFAQRRELVARRRSEREYAIDYASERYLRMAECGEFCQ